MEFEFDRRKNVANRAKHGVDFSEVERFIWKTATVTEDRRSDYGEKRYVAQGFIGNRLHILIFTIRGECCRVISLRKSNARERKSYEKTH